MNNDNATAQKASEEGRIKQNWISNSIHKYSQYKKNRATDRYHENAVDKASRVNAVATWVIAFFTLLTVAVGISTAIIMNRTLDEMRAGGADTQRLLAYTKQSADAAQVAASAAIRQINLVEREQKIALRPYLVNAFTNEPVIDGAFNVTVSKSYVNTGKTAALNIQRVTWLAGLCQR